MTTKTAEKNKAQGAQTPQEAPPAQLPATIQPRLSYPKSVQEAFGIGPSEWLVLIDVIFPNATSSASVVLALRYCRARNLDVMKKMIHIVPMYSKALNRLCDTIWPGIAEVRVTATRTGAYAGRDEEKYGPEIEREFLHIDDRNGDVKERKVIKFPEWCQLTVYKIVQGQRCAFVGPKVFWDEAYATESRYSKIPNEMWQERPHGQVGKCAEAASLRAAFPEETGGQQTAEEMHGKVIEGDIDPETMVVQGDVIVPPRPKQSDFAPKATPAKEPVKVMAGGVDVTDRMPLTAAELEKQRPKVETPGDIPETLRREPVDIGQQQPEPEPEAPMPSVAFTAAMTLLDKVEATMIDVKDLDAFKKEGRINIDKEPNITEDEREELRSRFTTMVYSEQRRRAQKGRK